MNTIDRIKDAARNRGLFLLREMARREPLAYQDISKRPVQDVLAALDEKELRFKAAILFRSQHNGTPLSDNDVIGFFHSLCSVLSGSHKGTEVFSAVKSCENMLCFGRTELVVDLVGAIDGFRVEPDPVPVANAVEAGLAFLRNIWPEEVKTISDHVDVCVGLRTEEGEVRCLSDINIPGFIAIAYRNPPVLIAEQLVHESTHVYLATEIENDGYYAELMAKLPPCYSPFTHSVRPAERVLHGVISYGRVLMLWEKISKYGHSGTQFFGGMSHQKFIKVIDRRISELCKRVTLGWQSLLRSSIPDEIDVLKEIVVKILGVSVDHLCKNTEIPLKSIEIGHIERAEFLLASRGYKASRIGLKVGDSEIFEAMISTKVPYAISKQAYHSKPDHKTLGFSNTFDGTENILFASKNAEVLCYIGKDTNVVRATLELDAVGRAGDAFGIPRCCQSHFLRTWNAVRENGGDLFAAVVRSIAIQGTASLPWQCNAAAMYFGGGICWHFPCSATCDETIKMVNQRLENLLFIDPELASSLVKIQRSRFFLKSDGSYTKDSDESDTSSIAVVPF